MEKIILNGQEYIKSGGGKRYVVVVDKGWIFAGDLMEDRNRIKLYNAVWVFKWENIGFDGVLREPKHANVTLKKLDHLIDIPMSSEIYRVLVEDNWGL